jgi:type IV pilus assembly protein PilP
VKRTGLILLTAMLAACGSDEHVDIKQWMNEQSRDMRGVVPKLPEVKPFPIVSYNAMDQLDPFQPAKIEPEKKQGGGGIKPDLDRPREELESYSLDSLKFVGTIKSNQALFAIIAVSGDRRHYRVKKGNYMGENFGIVSEILPDDGKLTLRELVLDPAGDWVERTTTLELQPGQEGKK